MGETKSSVRRCLFGRPDHAVVDQWLKYQLAEISRLDMQRWGFNFASGSPSTSEDAPFQWFAMNAGSVPALYKAASYRGPSAPESAPDPQSIEVDSPEPEPATPAKDGRQSTLTDFFGKVKRSPSEPSKRRLSHSSLSKTPSAGSSKPKRRKVTTS